MSETANVAPSRAADLEGKAGRAWAYQLPDKWQEPAHAATLGSWLVHAPAAHPWWSWYVVSMVHLREIEGVEPADKRSPDASHELLIVSLDPGEELPDPDNPDARIAHFLYPPNVSTQMRSATDAQALEVAELGVKAIVIGAASPDSDWRGWWQQAIPQTLEHVVTGGHGMSNN